MIITNITYETYLGIACFCIPYLVRFLQIAHAKPTNVKYPFIGYLETINVNI